MQIDPNSHMFEPEDLQVLLAIYDGDCSLEQAAVRAGITRQDIYMRLTYLRLINHAELIQRILDGGAIEWRYQATERGRKLVDITQRLTRQGVRNSPLETIINRTIATEAQGRVRHCAGCGCVNHDPTSSWHSKECLEADRARRDTVFLWSCGVRVDDDLVTPQDLVAIGK